MDVKQELDFLVAYNEKARCLEEIFFCTLHPQLVGLGRRGNAIKSYAEACTRIEKMRDAFTSR